MIKGLLDLLNEEINVKKITFEKNTDKFMEKTLKPNHSKIGPKYKEKAKLIAQRIEETDKQKLYNTLEKNKEIILDINGEKIKLLEEDFETVQTVKEHIAETKTEDVTLILDTKLTPELEAEGFAREMVRRIQSMRKELNLDVEDKIKTEIKTDKEKTLQNWTNYIKGETRSKKILFTDKPSGKLVKKWKIDELTIEIGIKK